jgi:probable rRNA maturation factor
MLQVSKTVKKSPPLSRAFLIKAKKTILGENYALSVVFIGDKKSKKLNFLYRKINKPTDILSFELDKNFGEIYINPKIAEKKSKEFEKSYPEYLQFLFIHGLCHLKGMVHGSKMEKQEKKYLANL